MEFEELKNRWSSLEEQLKKQEILNEKLIREIRQSRSGPVGTLIKYSYFSLFLLVLAFVFLIYLWSFRYMGVFVTSLFLYAFAIILVTFVINLYNLRQIKKIDFTQSVCKNIQIVYSYKVNVKKQLLGVYLAVAILVAGCLIFACFLPHVESWRWVVVGVAIPASVVLGYLEYKKIYKEKIDEILKSLEELKELEE